MCIACERSGAGLVCDPVYPPGWTGRRFVVAALVACSQDGEEVHLAEVHCSLGYYYLTKTFYAPRNLEWFNVNSDEGLMPNYDLLMPSQEMEDNYQALGYYPFETTKIAMKAIEQGYRLAIQSMPPQRPILDIINKNNGEMSVPIL
jgi:hypothetical protein